MDTETAQNVFISSGFPLGRLISGSKSGYSRAHPTHTTVFNSNVVAWSLGKIWFGDLDLTTDGETLKIIARKIKEPLYVLYEMDARFGEENCPIEVLVGKAAWNTTQEIPGKE